MRFKRRLTISIIIPIATALAFWLFARPQRGDFLGTIDGDIDIWKVDVTYGEFQWPEREPWGIRKALAFNYVWTGRIDEALSLMADIPEAGDEMSVYAWWWGTQGRDDLAAGAVEMSERLEIEREKRSVGNSP